MSVEIGSEFIRVAREGLRDDRDRVLACLRRLSAEQVWIRRHEVENSVGNLVLHLCGNVRQWILSGIGGAEDRRVRSQEFSAHNPLPAEELARRLTETLDAADAVLAGLPSDRLLERRRIQVYDVTILHAIHHVVVHFAGHVGQIIWATKHSTGQDLGFYRYLERNGSDTPPQPSP